MLFEHGVPTLVITPRFRFCDKKEGEQRSLGFKSSVSARIFCTDWGSVARSSGSDRACGVSALD
jgi:hypothetical protein